MLSEAEAQLFPEALARAEARRLVCQGEELFRRKEYSEALRIFDMAVPLDPKSITARSYTAAVLHKLEAYSQRDEMLASIITLPERHTGDVLEKGYAFAILGRHDSAVGRFRIALLRDAAQLRSAVGSRPYTTERAKAERALRAVRNVGDFYRDIDRMAAAAYFDTAKKGFAMMIECMLSAASNQRSDGWRSCGIFG